MSSAMCTSELVASIKPAQDAFMGLPETLYLIWILLNWTDNALNLNSPKCIVTNKQDWRLDGTSKATKALPLRHIEDGYDFPLPSLWSTPIAQFRLYYIFLMNVTSNNIKLGDVLGSSELQDLLTDFSNHDKGKRGLISLSDAIKLLRDQYKLPKWNPKVLQRLILSNETHLSFD